MKSSQPHTTTQQPNNPTTKSSFWDLIWPTIAGAITAKLFGIVGALVIFGAYFWLKPKLGVWGAVAASSVAGVAFAVGLAVMLENFAANPTNTIPSAESPQSSKPTPTVDSQEQQRALLSAAREILAKYPQLDPDSPKVDQSAIDFVIVRRNAYSANGHAIDLALRMAANDYGEQLAASQRREAEQRYAQQIATHRFNQSSTGQAQPVTNDYIRRKNESCQPKDVMTDEEIARCRSR